MGLSKWRRFVKYLLSEALCRSCTLETRRSRGSYFEKNSLWAAVEPETVTRTHDSTVVVNRTGNSSFDIRTVPERLVEGGDPTGKAWRVLTSRVGEPAHNAGLRKDDLILTWNGIPPEDIDVTNNAWRMQVSVTFELRTSYEEKQL